MSLWQDFPWSNQSTLSSLIAVLGNLAYLGLRPNAPIYPIQTAGNDRRERLASMSDLRQGYQVIQVY